MDLGNLYQDVILEHNRNPRNWGELSPPTERADGRNPPQKGSRVRLHPEPGHLHFFGVDGRRIC